jgi:hypothetical protein
MGPLDVQTGANITVERGATAPIWELMPVADRVGCIGYPFRSRRCRQESHVD